MAACKVTQESLPTPRYVLDSHGEFCDETYLLDGDGVLWRRTECEDRHEELSAHGKATSTAAGRVRTAYTALPAPEQGVGCDAGTAPTYELERTADGGTARWSVCPTQAPSADGGVDPNAPYVLVQPFEEAVSAMKALP